jgi:hypothetical protein
MRVRVGHSQLMPESLAQEWLLIAWLAGEAEPTRYWLSTLPADISFRKLVDFAKLGWRIERDYQELKQEVLLGHYEGRGWRGFHHRATTCIAAYGFQISETETILLRTSSHHAVPDGCASQPLSTQGISPCGLNATFRLDRNRACLLDQRIRQNLPRSPCCGSNASRHSHAI